MLQSITELRVLQSITEYYRVVQSITEYYYRVLQSITKTNLAHLLGPIFGLVFTGPPKKQLSA